MPAQRQLWAVAVAAVLLWLAWRLTDVLLLAFAGVLFAVVLRSLAEPLQRQLHWPERIALVAVIAALVLLIGGGAWVAGASAVEQLQALRETLPRALEALRQWLGERSFGRRLMELWTAASFLPDDWQRLAGLATGTLNATLAAAGALVLVVAIGIYLAADPQTYLRGIVRLVPPSRRALAKSVLGHVGNDLARWLLGQGVSMLAVGVLTAIGLAAIGMPLVFTLAAIAALLDFVPYFGPIAAGVLIVAVAFTEGEGQALSALLVCLAVQQIEAYVVQPLAQRWAVRMPPVLGMLSVLLFGLLFGLPGLLLAVPLMVMLSTLVQRLYVDQLFEGEAVAAAPAEAGPAPQRKADR